MTDSTALPAGGPTREEIAKIEIGHTTVSPAVARGLFAFFIFCIVAVPFVEIVGAQRIADVLNATIWSRLAGIPNQISVAVQAEAAKGNTSLWRRAVTANRAAIAGLVDFENALEDESILGRTLRPPAQWVLSGWLGVGNERVYVGRDRWLFYRPDVEYVTGRPFLDPAQLRRRIEAAPEWTAPPAPDPRPAIVQFKEDLAARGILLIVMPTPVKPAVHPEMMSASLAGATDVVHNASYRTLVEDLRAAGVIVFDPSKSLTAARHAAAQYFATDTHWTPEAMETAAAMAAAVVSSAVALPAAPDPGYLVERVEIKSLGDTAKMLDLRDTAALFPPETVWLRRVLQPDGSLWRASRDADVLLLGDSFSNIFSLESMGWGTSAGLAEHLSFALRRPVDRLVQNDEAAFATRSMLQREPGRLEGKRVVIYQFAVRELSEGDWKILPFVP